MPTDRVWMIQFRYDDGSWHVDHALRVYPRRCEARDERERISMDGIWKPRDIRVREYVPVGEVDN